MVFSVADRIRYLRDKAGMTQTDLAKRLGISRSAVNSWEMSLSSPSLSNIIEMSQIFHVNVDYIISISDKLCLDITDLDAEERSVVIKLVECLSKNHEKK